MKSAIITIKNAHGFHMRPASTFVNAMMKYECSVVIKYNGFKINGKSMMNIISACMKCGSEIELICNGNGEEQAFNEAVNLIESGFGE